MTHSSIREFHEALKSGETSVEREIKEYLGVIREKNEELNIFLTVTEEEAVKRAKELDLEFKEKGEAVFEEKPLFGVAVGHKDLFMTKGVKTTAGSKVLEDHIAAYDASVVKKLSEAGAVSLGKLNCDAWAHGSSGENSQYGATKNPVNPEYVPGGSSSGSAAAIAARMTLITTGTDTGGSIRLPANFCGVAGLKPTYGRVSRYGVIAMASSLDSIGHLANNVEDLAKVLEVTSGSDVNDANTADSLPFRVDELSGSLKGVKLGVPKEYLQPIKNGEVKGNFEEVVKKLEEAGAEIVEISLPHTEYATAVYYVLQPAEVSSNLGRYDGIRYGRGRESFGDEAVRRILIGTFTLSAGYYDAYYKRALEVRTLIKEDFDKALAGVEAILAPVSPTPPFKLGEKTSDPLEMYLSDIFTISVNLAGIPAVAFPSGKTSNGLPLGIQVIGKRYSEEKILPISYQIEQLLK